MNTNQPGNFKSIVFTFFLFTVFCFSNGTATAQTSSPYSRYGVGDIGGKGFAQGFTLGGTHIALQNDTTPIFYINNGNPASYVNARYVTAELGARYNRLTLQSADEKNTINNASLGYIALGFPIKKWWGASAGLIPFSSVGYKVSDEQDIASIGKVKYLYEGSGGINQVYLGNAIKPLYGLPRNYLLSSKYRLLNSKKHADNTPKTCQEIFDDKEKIRLTYNRKKLMQSLALGANASYLFGNMENTRRSIFPSTLYAFNTRTGTSTRIDGLYFDYGMQMAYTFDSVKVKVVPADSCHPYRFRDLKENVKVMFGVTFAAQSKMDATIDSLSYSYFNNSLGYEIVKDTIENTKGATGKITLPLSIGFGMAVKKGDKWLIAGDVAIQNWSTYSAFGQSQGLRNTLRTSLGAQFIPDSKPTASYLKRVNYRIGVRYLQTALELKNTPLNEYGASFGFGLPIGTSYAWKTFSMLNIGVEIGQRGTTTNGLIKENYIKATVGFTINDRWFQQPKFD